MAFKSTYVSGNTIYVEYYKNGVSIVNGPTLKVLDPRTVAEVVKTNYKVRIGESLDITTDSLAIEIFGHVQPDKFLRALDGFPMPSSLRETVENLLNRTEIIDCGTEEAGDSNRWVWDKLDSLGFEDLIIY